MSDAQTLDYAQSAPPPPDPIPLRRRLAAEFVGTFALVFAGCGAIVAGVDHVGVALTFGLVIMALIYAVGDISGAHFNPAVTFGFALSRRMRLADASLFAAAQCAAAVLAGAVLWLAWPGAETVGPTLPSPTESHPRPGLTVFHHGPLALARSFGYEIILSFFLVFVILSVAIGSKERGLMAGIAIGGTIAFCALFGGPVSGASMNPARSLGPALFSGSEAIMFLWIYLIAPFIGAALAVAAWTYIYRHPRPAVEVHEVTEPSQ